MKTLTKKNWSLKSAVSCAILIIVILIGVLLMVSSYVAKRNLVVTGYGEQTIRIAQTVASAIDTERFTGTIESGETDEYWFEVKALLDRTINTTGVMFIYTLLPGYDDEITYFATGDIIGAEWPVDFLHKDATDWYPPELFYAMDTGTAANTGIYDADEFGILIGGFAPLFDSSGNVAGLVGVEINVDDVVATINTSMLVMILFALGVLTVFFVLAMFVANRGLIKPVKEMTQIMSKVCDGDFDLEYPKSSIREIKILSESFGNMIKTISTVIEEIQKRNQEIIDGNLTKVDDGFTAKGDYQKILDGADAIRVNMASHMEELAQQLKIINEGIRYASKIQTSIIPDSDKLGKAFSDFSVIWKPRDIVGGDIYWAKNFDDGTVLCVCDCTGHGTPGALLTMLVVSAFESTITKDNHKDTADILYMLDKRIASVLNVKSSAEEYSDINDGCDLAVLFIANDGTVTFSSGNTNIFISDGKEVTRHRGQKIYVGEGKIKNKDKIKTTVIRANPESKFYIASDGLYDQIGGDDKIPYGYDEFERLLLENHSKKHKFISDTIWQSFESYRGDNTRRDDFELITFTPKINNENGVE